MNGIVLAAGEGRRLRPLTDRLPKTLLEVSDGTTILDVALRNLAHVEVREIAIVTGFAAEAIDARLPELAARYGVRPVRVFNDRASEWNNAYSLWLARDHLADGALVVNGDTVHPPSVEEALLRERGSEVSIALDAVKHLGEEEMKVILGPDGRMTRINKAIDPATADGEYIGVTLVEPRAAAGLAGALQVTWRRDPSLYYEDGFQEFADRGGEVRAVRIGDVPWVEVDDHDDLVRARAIAAASSRR